MRSYGISAGSKSRPCCTCVSCLQRELTLGLLQAQTKQWLATHAKRLPLPPLSPKVLAFIKEWYYLVDTDGSGELSLDEVAAAMQVKILPFLLLFSLITEASLFVQIFQHTGQVGNN